MLDPGCEPGNRGRQGTLRELLRPSFRTVLYLLSQATDLAPHTGSEKEGITCATEGPHRTVGGTPWGLVTLPHCGRSGPAPLAHSCPPSKVTRAVFRVCSKGQGDCKPSEYVGKQRRTPGPACQLLRIYPTMPPVRPHSIFEPPL